MPMACTVSQIHLLISYKIQMLEFMIGQAGLNDRSELVSWTARLYPDLIQGTS